MRLRRPRATATEPHDLALPAGYTALLGELKNRVRAARAEVLRTVTAQLINLYRSIGRTTLERQATDGWGSRVIARLAEDPGAEFHDMTRLPRSDLQYMRSFAEAWPAWRTHWRAKLPGPVANLALDFVRPEGDISHEIRIPLQYLTPKISCVTRADLAV
mgnify:CR=1 FL=1